MNILVGELVAAARNVSEENLCMSTPALVRLDAAIAAIEKGAIEMTDRNPDYHCAVCHKYLFSTRAGEPMAEGPHYCDEHKPVRVGEHNAGPYDTSNRLTIADYEQVIADHNALVRRLDVALNGAGAAKQASLVDIVMQMERTRCPKCNGNDREAPCAYPEGGHAGCLRDYRLVDEALRQLKPTLLLTVDRLSRLTRMLP